MKQTDEEFYKELKEKDLPENERNNLVQDREIAKMMEKSGFGPTEMRAVLSNVNVMLEMARKNGNIPS